MLHREDADGLVVIGQPAHAWVSAQIARAWGNARFGGFEPRDEVCLAAEQHDVGHAAWEAAPTLNPATGRPHSFVEQPLGGHLSLLSAAAPLVLPQSRYAALLVSLHLSRLFEDQDPSALPREDARAVGAFLAGEQALQEELLAGLRADAVYAPFAAADVVARNRGLVLAWDRLSLVICHGLRAPQTLPSVPAAAGEAALTLVPVGGDPCLVGVAPWPFARDTVELTCEGRRVPETFTDEAAMRAALTRAPWVTLRTRLQLTNPLEQEGRASTACSVT